MPAESRCFQQKELQKSIPATSKESKGLYVSLITKSLLSLHYTSTSTDISTISQASLQTLADLPVQSAGDRLCTLENTFKILQVSYIAEFRCICTCAPCTESFGSARKVSGLQYHSEAFDGAVHTGQSGLHLERLGRNEPIATCRTVS